MPLAESRGESAAEADYKAGARAWRGGWGASPDWESASAPAVADWALQLSRRLGQTEERAAEIMRRAESSRGFPIFGKSSSCSRGSRSFGSADRDKVRGSCSRTRSSDSKAIYLLSSVECRLSGQVVRGTSCAECTCSPGLCSTGAKVAPVVLAFSSGCQGRGDSGSGHWMTSVADEGHLDSLVETSQRRSSQELRRLCKAISECVYIYTCACSRLLCIHPVLPPSIHNVEFHSCVLPCNEENLDAAIIFSCQILGRAPHNLHLTL